MKTITDFIQKVLKSLKSMVIVGLIAVCILFIVNYGCEKRANQKLFKTVTEVNLKNKSLDEVIINLQTDLRDEAISRQQVEANVKLKDDSIAKLVKENKSIRNQLAGISNQVDEISNDSSYQFVSLVAYPFEGEKIYPFNGFQVKGIHKSFLENKSLLILSSNQEKQIYMHSQVIKDKDNQLSSYAISLGKSQAETDNRDQVIANKNIEISAKDKALNKKNTGKNIFKTVALGEAVFILIKFVL